VEKKDGTAGIIKMFDRGAGRALIVSSNHDCTLRQVDRLWAVVWADYPQLTEDDVEVVMAGYGRYRTIGLVFKVGGHPSDEYRHMSPLPDNFTGA
jgi:hypothetical protein